jgi:hypothetical protein
MSIEHDEYGDALDKILAAARNAAPPEGMEARITDRLLQRQATAPPASPFRWRDAFANSARTGEWWRGTISGAAAVLLMTATFLLAGRLLQTRPDRIPMARNSTDRSVATAGTYVTTSPYGIPASEARAQPCADPTMLRAANVVPTYSTDGLGYETHLESEAPSQLAPPLPLTAQERAMIRLVQTASPRQLATLNPEEYANLEAQSALKFEKYFAPPAPPSTADGNAAITSIVSSEVISDGDPKSDSAANPEKPEAY